MKLRSIFTTAAASAAILGGGYAGYEAAPRLHAALSDQPAPAVSGQGRRAAETFNLRLTAVVAEQQIVDNTTDDEDAGRALDEDKKAFATDIILDKNLSERDLAHIAARFNAMGLEDGIRLRAYNFDPRTMARRDECLAFTPAAAAPFGADRYAYAQRVETCMIDALQRAPHESAALAKPGALLGAGVAGSTFLGFAIGRRSRRGAKPAK